MAQKRHTQNIVTPLFYCFTLWLQFHLRLTASTTIVTDQNLEDIVPAPSTFFTSSTNIPQEQIISLSPMTRHVTDRFRDKNAFPNEERYKKFVDGPIYLRYEANAPYLHYSSLPIPTMTTYFNEIKRNMNNNPTGGSLSRITRLDNAMSTSTTGRQEISKRELTPNRSTRGNNIYLRAGKRSYKPSELGLSSDRSAKVMCLHDGRLWQMPPCKLMTRYFYNEVKPADSRGEYGSWNGEFGVVYGNI